MLPVPRDAKVHSIYLNHFSQLLVSYQKYKATLGPVEEKKLLERQEQR